MKIKDLLDDYLSRKKLLGNVTRNTVLTYERMADIAVRTFGAGPIKKLNRAAVERVYGTLRSEGYSPATIACLHSLVSSALDDAVANGLLPANPARGAARPKRAARSNPNIPQDGVQRLLAEAQTHPLGAMLRFALATGLRRGEAAALDWGDFDWHTKAVSVTKQIVQNGQFRYGSVPKSAAGVRKVTLPDSVFAEFWALYHAEPHKPTDAVFVDGAGKRLTPAALTEGAKRVLRSVGLGAYSLHDLRHTHVSRLVSSGMPIPAVAARVGHADPKTTLSVYSHPEAGEDAKLAAQIEKVMH